MVIVVIPVNTIFQNSIMKVKISSPEPPAEMRCPLKIDYAAALPDSNLWLQKKFKKMAEPCVI